MLAFHMKLNQRLVRPSFSGGFRDFPTVLKLGPGDCCNWEKSIWPIKVGKLDAALKIWTAILN